MPRTLVVVREGLGRGARPGERCTDLDDAACNLAPCQRVGLALLVGGAVDVDRVEVVRGEQMLEVHQDQLLMLLLMIAAQLEQPQRRLVVVAALEKFGHRGVDIFAIPRDVGDAGAGDQPAVGSRMSLADGLVVAVEQIAEGLVVHHV